MVVCSVVEMVAGRVSRKVGSKAMKLVERRDYHMAGLMAHPKAGKRVDSLASSRAD